MTRKILFMLAKVVWTIILIYSALTIFMETVFSFLAPAHPLSTSGAITELFIPYTTAEIAIILVISYIWIPRKNKDHTIA